MTTTMKRRNKFPIVAAVKHIGKDTVVAALVSDLLAAGAAMRSERITDCQKALSEYQTTYRMLLDRIEEMGVVLPAGYMGFVTASLCEKFGK